MTFEQFWTILIKQWKLVIICFLFVGIGAFVGSKLMKPVYQSSALVQVVIRSSSNNQADYNALMASDQLVQTEATLATSSSVLREVASHYPGLTVSEFAGSVSASPKTNTQLFEIDVVDSDPARAARLTNDVAATLIKQQQQRIQEDNDQARQQIQQNIDLANTQINDTTMKISALQARGGGQGQINLLQAQLNGLQQHASQWQTALAQLELTQAQSGNPLQVAQPAQPAISPVRPNVRLNTAIGFLAGLLLGLLLALAYEQLDTRVRTPEAITKLLGWSVLTTIWRVGSAHQKDIINPIGQDANVEAYRILRTNIGFASMDKPLQSMLVTSPSTHDGKSTTAANLAIFMARAGKNTLLIDADLHRPTQHTLFGLTGDKLGLSNAVLAFSASGEPNSPFYYQMPSHPSEAQIPAASGATNVSLDPFVHTVGIPNLWVMPSGPLPPNPSEFLESKVMQRFLTIIAKCGIEMVIFDTPPLLGLSDVSILAPRVDGVLVVVDITSSTKGKLGQVKAILTQPGVHVIGCVANKVRRKRNDNSYYYYSQTENQSNGEIPMKNGQQTFTSANPVPVDPSLSGQNVRSN